METVGVYLKKEREAKAISLGEVARLTKISKFYLDYIEKDEFEKLPQGPYIKGYISSYSEQIGSDVDEALKLYDALNKKENLTETVDPDDWKREESEFSSEKKPMEEWETVPTATPTNNTFSMLRATLYSSVALLVAGILVLAGFGIYHLFLFEKEPPEIADVEPSPQPQKSVAPVPETVMDTQTDHLDVSEPKLPEQKVALNQEKRSELADAVMVPSPQRALLNAETIPPVDVPEIIPVATVMAPEEPISAVNLKVVDASICSDIQDRTPVGRATSFPSSTPRVYVWTQVQANLIPSEIRHIYYFNDRKISEVTLKVRSKFWRTWSYKTLPGGKHRGQWRVDISTVDGTLLKQLEFEIK